MKNLMFALALIGSTVGTAPVLAKKFIKPQGSAIAAFGRSLAVKTAVAKAVPKTSKPKTVKKPKSTKKSLPVKKKATVKKTKPVARAASVVAKKPAMKKKTTPSAKKTKTTTPKSKAAKKATTKAIKPKSSALQPVPSQSFSVSLPSGQLDFENGSEDQGLSQEQPAEQADKAICS